MQFVIAAALVLSLIAPAVAQQVPRPTSDQVVQQILENEARGYRQTIGQLAIQVNDLTAKIEELKKKCGDSCK